MNPFDPNDPGYDHVIGNHADAITGRAIKNYIVNGQKDENFPFRSVKPVPLEEARYNGIRMDEVATFFMNYMTEIIGEGVLPEQIINMDEIGLGGQGAARKQAQKVLTTAACQKARKTAIRATARVIDHCTIIPMVAGNGCALRTWVIHKGKKTTEAMEKILQQGRFLGIAGGNSSSVTKQIMRDNLVDAMEEYRKELKKPALPLYIICDGHISRKDSKLLLLLKEYNIRLLLLPAHTTHMLQPIDVVLAKIVKAGHAQAPRVAKTGKNTGKLTSTVTSDQVLKLRLNNIHKALSPGNIQTSFAAPGLIPFVWANIDKRFQAPRKTNKTKGRTTVEQLFDKLRSFERNRTVGPKAYLASILDEYKQDIEYTGFHGLGGRFLTDDDVIKRIIEAEQRENSRATPAARTLQPRNLELEMLAAAHAAESESDTEDEYDSSSDSDDNSEPPAKKPCTPDARSSRGREIRYTNNSIFLKK